MPSPPSRRGEGEGEDVRDPPSEDCGEPSAGRDELVMACPSPSEGSVAPSEGSGVPNVGVLELSDERHDAEGCDSCESGKTKSSGESAREDVKSFSKIAGQVGDQVALTLVKSSS